MLRIYCRGRHGRRRGLCPACEGLQAYAHARLTHCPFGEQKTSCAQCPVHCYKADRRAEIREVMRYAGPRMIYHHPLLALQHQLAALRSRRKSRRQNAASV